MSDRAYRTVGCAMALACLVFWTVLIFFVVEVAFGAEPVIVLDRYRVSVQHEIDGEMRESGVSETSFNSALFHWRNPKNYEVLFKMVDACGPYDQVWVFISSASSITHHVSVTDQNTGQEHTYVMKKDENGDMFPIIDTERWEC